MTSLAPADPRMQATECHAQVCETFSSSHQRIINYDILLCTVPDPCLSQPCDPNADCMREGVLSEIFTCMCRAPFTVGDGFTCSGI